MLSSKTAAPKSDVDQLPRFVGGLPFARGHRAGSHKNGVRPEHSAGREVSYVIERVAGLREARRVVCHLRPRLELDLQSVARVMAAAHLKAQHPIAYADAFALATAMANDADLLTGDPEIVDGDPMWPVVGGSTNMRSVGVVRVKVFVSTSSPTSCQERHTQRALRFARSRAAAHEQGLASGEPGRCTLRLGSTETGDP